MTQIIKIFRILRIWYFGKLSYVKKYKRWLNGRLFRSIDELSDRYLNKMIEKYGDNNCTLMIDLLSNNLQQLKNNDQNNR